MLYNSLFYLLKMLEQTVVLKVIILTHFKILSMLKFAEIFLSMSNKMYKKHLKIQIVMKFNLSLLPAQTHIALAFLSSRLLIDCHELRDFKI